MDDADQVAPDGSPVAVFRSLPAGSAAAIVDGALPPGVAVLDLGCGAGRLATALASLGHPAVGVDICPAMLSDASGFEPIIAPIEGLDLGRAFGGVVLASYLINDEAAPAYLATCRRHVLADGAVVIQRYDPEWAAEGVDDSVEVGDVTVSVSGLSAVEGSLSLVVGYDIGDHHWDQPVSAVLRTAADIERLAADAGLSFDRWLDPYETWGRLVVADGSD